VLPLYAHKRAARTNYVHPLGLQQPMLKQSALGLETRLSSGALQIRHREIQLYHVSLTESGLGLVAALLAEMAIVALVQGACRPHHYSRTTDTTSRVSRLLPGSAAHAVFVLLTVGAACAALNALVLTGGALKIRP